jgi:hypothetical protein
MAIEPARRASFVLSHVVVNTVPDRDDVRLRIREFHGPDSREVELRIRKTPSTTSVSSPSAAPEHANRPPAAGADTPPV